MPKALQNHMSLHSEVGFEGTYTTFKVQRKKDDGKKAFFSYYYFMLSASLKGFMCFHNKGAKNVSWITVWLLKPLI